MADKSAKEQAAAEEAAPPPKKPLNKQTAKVMQDGVELTWDMQTEGDLEPEAAAKFYKNSVEALQKFKSQDPRTAPELRKLKKDKEDFWKAFGHRANGMLIGIFIGVFLILAFGPRNCAESTYDERGRSRSFRR